MATILNQLRPNPGSTRGKIRVGRGIGSGKGKTSGRGGKGQTARSGSAINGFEGGQTPIHRRIPKRGFNNFNRKEFEVINVSDLQAAVEAKTLDGSKPINLEVLIEAGILKGRLDGLKILGTGKITSKIEIVADKASASAVKAVEKAGGKITLGSAKAPKVKKAEGEAKKAPKAKAEKKPAKAKKESK